MKVRTKFGNALAALTLLLAPFAASAKPNGPALSIPLQSIGFEPIAARYLLAGDSMYTLHFVDNDHLLVTFTTRGLIKRLPDAEPNDYDRNVVAVLLELPSGKILGKTQWQLRDHGQYLWPIGHGRFLFRIRNRLSLLSPMVNLPKGTPFLEEPFVQTDRHIGHIAVSPMQDLLTIETIPVPQPKPTGAAAAMAALSKTGGNAPPAPMELKKRPEPEVQIAFVRFFVDSEGGHPDKMIAQSAGFLKSQNLIEVAATSEGYLDIARERPGVYDFDFQPHGNGKRLELSPYDSTCIPHPRWISASEFVAFGCRGTEDKQELAGFNLKGEENWIDAFPNRHVFPSIVPAPATGRFALSRTLVSGTYIDVDNLTADQVSAQEISVLQSHDGRTLLKVQAAPIQRAAQNFDLSPDGTALTVVRADAIEVYKLPPVTKKDEEQIKLAASYAPAKNTARIDLGAGRAAAEEAKAPTTDATAAPTSKPEVAAEALPKETPAELGKAPEPPATPPATTASADTPATPPKQEVHIIQNGDEVYDKERNGPRQKPTLYDEDHPKNPKD